MQCAVKESEQPDHAPRFHEDIEPEDFPYGGDGKCQEKKNEREHAGRAGSELEWVGANLLEVQIPKEQGNRDERVYEDDGLLKLNGFRFQMTGVNPNLKSQISNGKWQMAKAIILTSCSPQAPARHKPSHSFTQKYLTRSIPS